MNRSTRTLMLWLLLVLLFVSIWMFFGGAQPFRAHERPVVGDSWPIYIASFVVVGLFFWSRYRAGSTVKFNQSQRAGFEALAEGDIPRAAAVFRELAHTFRRSEHLMLAASYNLGFAELRLGHFSEAERLLELVERESKKKVKSEISLVVALELFRLYTLKGELEKAQHWLDVADSRLVLSTTAQAAAAREVGYALLMCRQGHYRDAEEHLDRHWPKIEGTFSARNIREPWFVRAFAQSFQSGPRDADRSAQSLEHVRPGGGAELTYLGLEWPAMRDFLRETGLSAKPEAAPGAPTQDGRE